jgi:flagellar hook-associated protein 1 FlgK
MTVNWPQTITSATGGELGSLVSLSSSSGTVGQWSSALDSVAAALVSSVNSLSTTTPFFSGSNASNIAVDATPAQVQTASAADPGGNDVAQAIAGLAGGSADQAYAALVAQVGSGVQGATNVQTNSQAIVTAVENQRESVSGVSIDQEMANLMTYQNGYDASARALTTLDAMLQTLITQTGTVGL